VAQFKLLSIVCLQILRKTAKTADRITDLQNGIQTRNFVVKKNTSVRLSTAEFGFVSA
jgi:hypothetical protein